MAERVASEVFERLKIQERFDCWNRGEFELMEELYADDALFDVSAVFTDVAPIRGKPEIRDYWHQLRETWSGLRLDPIEVLDLGRGRYVAELRVWGRGERSGAEVEQRVAMFYEFRPEDLKAVSVRMLPDVDTALAEAEAAAEHR